MEDDPWAEIEALEDERRDADMQQAEYEAEGREHGRRQTKTKQLIQAGDKEGAAKTCPHSGGFPLDSLAAKYDEDPHVGADGWRCSDCGSRLSASPWDGGRVTVPCEVVPTSLFSV